MITESPMTILDRALPRARQEIAMRTITKTVEVQVDVFDLTREDLRGIRSALRGGNATHDTPTLLRFIADRLIEVHGENQNVDYIRALRDRAAFIEMGIKAVDDILSGKTKD